MRKRIGSKQLSALIMSAVVAMSSVPYNTLAEEPITEQVMFEETVSMTQDNAQQSEEATDTEDESAVVFGETTEDYSSDIVFEEESKTDYGFDDAGAAVEEDTSVNEVANEILSSDEISDELNNEIIDSAAQLPGDVDENVADEDSVVYALVNIPYSYFYAGELETVDSITAATLKGKARNINVNGASYHESAETVTTEGIAGAVYPVKVSLSKLKKLGGTQITDASEPITYEMTARGQTTTVTLEGVNILQESPSWSYYLLNGEPKSYKELDVVEGDGSVQAYVSAAIGTAAIVTGATGTVTLDARHTGGVEIALSGVEVTPSEVSGVIVTVDGRNYALHHVVNIWRGSEIGWTYDDIPDSVGKTLSNVRYFMKDGSIVDYPMDLQVVDSVKAVEDIIDALPSVENVTPETKQAADDAMAAYEALPDAKKELVNTEKKEKLIAVKEAADAAYEADKAAQAAADDFNEKVEAVKSAPAGEGKKAAVEVKEAYNALTDAAKGKLTDENIKAYQDTQDAYTSGRLFDCGNGTYRVLGGGDVTYNKPVDTTETYIQVPAEVVDQNGFKFKVVKVSVNAFKGCTKTTKIWVGKNIVTFGAYAFKGAANLKTLIIRTSSIASGEKVDKAFVGSGKNKGKDLTVQVHENKKAAYESFFRGPGGLSDNAKVVSIE